MTTIIFCDGGCHGNGTASAQTYGSFSVNGQVHRVPVNGKTNNQAEYLTLIEALEYCQLHQIQAPQIYMDSQLVVQQLTGHWRVKTGSLVPMWERAGRLVLEVKAQLTWVSRDQIVSVLGH